MIKLKRIRTAIPSGLVGKKLQQKMQQLATDKQQGITFDNDYWHRRRHWATARMSLATESHNKCAYCESPIQCREKDHPPRGDADHFRPKSVYWWLAYYYDNLIFSCQICNQDYKRGHFPKQASQTLAAITTLPEPLDENAVALFEQKLTDQPILINPYCHDPELLFKWIADSTLEEVEIAPISPKNKAACEAVKKYYGLNREGLGKDRWEIYKRLLGIKKDLEIMNKEKCTPGIQELKSNQYNILKEMVQDDYPFAAMVRYFVIVEWALLPA